MSTLSRTDRKYLDQLAHHLQALDVPGARIGEILAEAEAHADATGEPLPEAFGDPREYARQWAPPRRRPRWLVVPYAACTALGGFALGSGAFSVVAGKTSFGLPADWVALLGAALLIGPMVVVPVNPIRDPRTGATRGPSRRLLVLTMVAACVIVGAATVLATVLR